MKTTTNFIMFFSYDFVPFKTKFSPKYRSELPG